MPFHLQIENERFDDYVCLKDVEARIGFTPIEIIPDDSPQGEELEGTSPNGFSVG